MKEKIKAMHLSPKVKYATIHDAEKEANALRKHIINIVKKSEKDGKNYKLKMMIGYSETNPRAVNVIHIPNGRGRPTKDFEIKKKMEAKAQVSPHLHIAIESDHADVFADAIIKYYKRKYGKGERWVHKKDHGKNFKRILNYIYKQADGVRCYNNFDDDSKNETEIQDNIDDIKPMDNYNAYTSGADDSGFPDDYDAYTSGTDDIGFLNNYNTFASGDEKENNIMENNNQINNISVPKEDIVLSAYNQSKSLWLKFKKIEKKVLNNWNSNSDLRSELDELEGMIIALGQTLAPLTNNTPIHNVPREGVNADQGYLPDQEIEDFPEIYDEVYSEVYDEINDEIYEEIDQYLDDCLHRELGGQLKNYDDHDYDDMIAALENHDNYECNYYLNKKMPLDLEL